MFAVAAMAIRESSSCRLNFLRRWWNSSTGRLHEGLRLRLKKEFALSRFFSWKRRRSSSSQVLHPSPSDRVPSSVPIWANPRRLCLSDNTCTADSPNPVGVHLGRWDFSLDKQGLLPPPLTKRDLPDLEAPNVLSVRRMLGGDYPGKEAEASRASQILGSRYKGYGYIVRNRLRPAFAMSTKSKTSLDDGDDDVVHKTFSSTCRMPTAAKFSGISPLCGADKNDFLYVVEVHHGFTPRGPLNFRPGFYLRNGTGTEAPILAAAGDEEREPLLMSTFSVKSLIMVPPPLDEDDVEFNLNPRDLVTEIMYATKPSDGSVSFRFSVEGEANTQQNTRYILTRLPSSSSTSFPSPDILADLTFRNAISVNHLFTLELKGAACSGVMGDRWTLMVVTTALRLYWLRVYGKTNKAIVGIGQKLRGK
ncbi:hypothetical protein B0T13DRAFT_518065 [Neurospora crassa]|nr:hypothetical protein B0T13DRAFT_518065 [Neurospora crassa]